MASQTGETRGWLQRWLPKGHPGLYRPVCCCGRCICIVMRTKHMSKVVVIFVVVRTRNVNKAAAMVPVVLNRVFVDGYHVV